MRKDAVIKTVVCIEVAKTRVQILQYFILYFNLLFVHSSLRFSTFYLKKLKK